VSVSIAISSLDQDAPEALVLYLDSGPGFIVLRINNEVSFTLAGFDADSVQHARALASALANAAQSLEEHVTAGGASEQQLALRALGDHEYPKDWPRCHCGEPVLDGHLTCGNIACDEAAARDQRQREWVASQNG